MDANDVLPHGSAGKKSTRMTVMPDKRSGSWSDEPTAEESLGVFDVTGHAHLCLHHYCLFPPQACNYALSQAVFSLVHGAATGKIRLVSPSKGLA